MIEELFDLKGRRAMVTGGSSGIGLAMARALLQAGVEVAIVNRNAESGRKAVAELGREGDRVMAVTADVSQVEEVEAAVERTEEELGPLDILVNSHGINIRKKALDFEAEEWRKVIDINLSGAFYTCQAVGRRMIERGRGRVINISSVASRIGLANLAPYCASKGGLSQLTKTLALEWASQGVTVNAIGPGYIRTPLTVEVFKAPGFAERLKTLVPQGRVGEPEDLIGILLVLCSPAGAYITGQTILIDGGWSIW